MDTKSMSQDGHRWPQVNVHSQSLTPRTIMVSISIYGPECIPLQGLQTRQKAWFNVYRAGNLDGDWCGPRVALSTEVHFAKVVGSQGFVIQ